MDGSDAALRAALKVFTDLIAGRAVGPADVQALRRLSTLPADTEPVDVVCDVVQKILKCRAGSGYS